MPTATRHHISAPGAYRSEGPADAAMIATSVKALKERAHVLGAVFTELVRGSGGVIVQPHGWLKALHLP